MSVPGYIRRIKTHQYLLQQYKFIEQDVQGAKLEINAHQ